MGLRVVEGEQGVAAAGEGCGWPVEMGLPRGQGRSPAASAGNGGRLAPEELYRLRRARLAALEGALRARMAQQQVDALVLELERRHQLLGVRCAVDARTGAITLLEGFESQGGEACHGPAYHADPGAA